jgi:hypothetical protein
MRPCGNTNIFLKLEGGGARQMADFRQVLDFCELRDIDFCGVPWTYVNRKDGPRNVKVRLDGGGGATQEWIDLF